LIPVGKNNINKVIEKLFKLGVIGKFEVCDSGVNIHHKYWIFNPYLHFNGKTIKARRLHSVRQNILCSPRRFLGSHKDNKEDMKVYMKLLLCLGGAKSLFRDKLTLIRDLRS
jgi:hypothetical protein